MSLKEQALLAVERYIYIDKVSNMLHISSTQQQVDKWVKEKTILAVERYIFIDKVSTMFHILSTQQHVDKWLRQTQS